MKKLDYMLEVQAKVKELYRDYNVLGISEDSIHLKIGEFLKHFGNEIESYSWVFDEDRVSGGAFHLYSYYQGMKFVGVFNDYNMNEYFRFVNNNEKVGNLREAMQIKFKEVN
jgi:hypothetical protein